jgi:hypothetical protein
MAIGSGDRSYWHERAAETRALAEKTRDRRTREDLLAIAHTCERLAELSEETPHAKATKLPALMMAS